MSKPDMWGGVDQLVFDVACAPVVAQVKQYCVFAGIQLAYGSDGHWLYYEDGDVSYLMKRTAQDMFDYLNNNSAIVNDQAVNNVIVNCYPSLASQLDGWSSGGTLMFGVAETDGLTCDTSQTVFNRWS